VHATSRWQMSMQRQATYMAIMGALAEARRNLRVRKLRVSLAQ